MNRRDFITSVFSFCCSFGLSKLAESADSILVTDYNLSFQGLTNRSETRGIVIHHSGIDSDASSYQIHQSHLSRGWSGIGYHYLIRKDGSIETGRPIHTEGAHCEGYNDCTIGICLSGNFSYCLPSEHQMISAERIVAYLCSLYGLPLDRQYVLAHRQLSSTSCPGDSLYYCLDDFVHGAQSYL